MSKIIDVKMCAACRAANAELPTRVPDRPVTVRLSVDGYDC